MRVCVCERFTAAARWFLRVTTGRIQFNGNQLRVKSTRQNRYRVWETAKTLLWRALNGCCFLEECVCVWSPSISIRAAAVDMMVKAKQVINFNGQLGVCPAGMEEKLGRGRGMGRGRDHGGHGSRTSLIKIELNEPSTSLRMIHLGLSFLFVFFSFSFPSFAFFCW